MARILNLSTLFPNQQRPNFGIFVARQLIALAATGHEPVVINPIGLPPSPLSALQPYRALRTLPLRWSFEGLTVHHPRFTLIPRYGAKRNPKAIAKAVLPLARKLHGERPFDLVAADFFYPDGPAAMHIAEALGLPFTVKARGADIHHWGTQDGCREQILEAAGRASALLAVSAAMKADMVAMGMDEDAITVHYTGCDQDRFAPLDRDAAKADLDVSGPLIVTVGALIERKRQSLVLEALAALPDATLIIAGDGEDRSLLERKAAALEIADRIRFVGSVPHDTLPKLLGAADVMALPSRSEGLANAWVEALACGTPIVICDAGGARELLHNPIAGRIVEPNAGAVAQGIQDILDLAPDQQAVRDTIANFRWDVNGRKLADVFERVLEKEANSIRR